MLNLLSTITNGSLKTFCSVYVRGGIFYSAYRCLTMKHCLSLKLTHDLVRIWSGNSKTSEGIVASWQTSRKASLEMIWDLSKREHSYVDYFFFLNKHSGV